MSELGWMRFVGWVGISGLATNGLDALLEQNRQLVAIANIPQYDKDRFNDIDDRMFHIAYQYANDTSLGTKLRVTYTSWKEKDNRLVDSLQLKFDHFRFPIDSYIRQATGKWYRFHIRFDAAEYITRVHIPVLTIYGEKDVLLNAQKNAQNWQKYTAAAHNSHITIKIIPNLNHLLQHCTRSFLKPIAPNVLQEINNWLKTI